MFGHHHHQRHHKKKLLPISRFSGVWRMMMPMVLQQQVLRVGTVLLLLLLLLFQNDYDRLITATKTTSTATTLLVLSPPSLVLFPQHAATSTMDKMMMMMMMIPKTMNNGMAVHAFTIQRQYYHKHHHHHQYQYQDHHHHHHHQYRQDHYFPGHVSSNPDASSSSSALWLSSSDNDNDDNRRSGGTNIDKGFNLLELASQIVPQGRIVQTAKESWKFVWSRFMVELAPQDPDGNYQRPTYPFSQNTLGSQQYPVDDIHYDVDDGNGSSSPRYHVYVGNPCPWCHRVRLVVELLQLQTKGLVGMTQLVDDPIRASRGGWIFASPPPQASKVRDLRQLYELLCQPGYQGRCTAPLLVDWKTRTVVSNESKDIVRMLPLLLLQSKQQQQQQQQKEENQKNGNVDSKQGGDHPHGRLEELCPAELQSTIDETNAWIYSYLNNGVYQCGFATTQQAYDRASAKVRTGLERCDELLSKSQSSQSQYLCGDRFTESDVMLFPTMVRFDAVYAPLFGAGGSRQIRLSSDYPHIGRWMRHCWQTIPGISNSIDLPDACQSYYKQLFPLNPGGIVPQSSMLTPQRLGLED